VHNFPVEQMLYTDLGVTHDADLRRKSKRRKLDDTAWRLLAYDAGIIDSLSSNAANKDENNYQTSSKAACYMDKTRQNSWHMSRYQDDSSY
jgi:hypothetical protein